MRLASDEVMNQSTHTNPNSAVRFSTPHFDPCIFFTCSGVKTIGNRSYAHQIWWTDDRSSVIAVLQIS